jgi:MFS family permease
VVAAHVGARPGTGPAVAFGRDQRWNFAVLGGDIALFTFGLSISSAYTILPLFVHHLSASNVAVALIPAVRALGLYAPQLAVSSQVERLRRAKPLILFVTTIERLPFLVLALAAPLLAARQPAVLLVLFYLMIGLHQLGGGLGYPAWLDLIARTIPDGWRGRFFGLWTGVGGLLGIGGAAIAAAIIAGVAWPLSFSLIFAGTFAAFIVSFILLALGREPSRQSVRPRPAAARDLAGSRPLAMAAPAVRQRARGLVAIFRADRGLSALVAANAAAGVATMGAGLFAVSALGRGGLTPVQVGAESTVLVLATTAGTVLWGFVGDHVGQRAVLVCAALCMALAVAAPLLASGLVAYTFAFLLLGLSVSAALLAQLTFIAEFAPPARRPTYIALASVAYAPFAVGAPIIGGVLADHWGYRVVYAIALAAAMVAAVVYQLWVPEPRHGVPRTAPQVSPTSSAARERRPREEATDER